MRLIKSKKRIADYGEVFTPSWLTDSMIDLVKGEADRINSRFLESACGNGNFLVKVLQRKLTTVELKFRKSNFEKLNYGFAALMSIYGIEILSDNVRECRTNLMQVFSEYLGFDDSSNTYKAAYYVLFNKIIHGDAMKMRTLTEKPITFSEWGYIGNGKFQRRDFRYDVLASSSAFSAEGSLFSHLGKHEIFQPVKTYPLMTISELASAFDLGLEEHR